MVLDFEETLMRQGFNSSIELDEELRVWVELYGLADKFR
jgi:hypothetical protein